MPLHKHIHRLSNLLRLAEENHTLDPSLLRKIKKKQESGGSLSAREKSMLERARLLEEKLNEGPQELEGTPAPDEPIWSYFISEEQWNKIPDDKKPVMEEYFQKAYQNTTKGKEHAKKLNESDFAPGEVVEEGDHPSAVRRYAKSLGLKTKNVRRLISSHLDQMSSDPELKQEMQPLVARALAPLDELDTLLKRVEFALSEITPQTYASKVPLADKSARKAISSFREWGSDIGSIFGEDRQKYQKMSDGLRKVLADRFKHSLRELRSQGMSAEEASEKAKAVPSIQKMNSALIRANSRIKAYDLVLNEMASIYDNSRPMLKSMETALDNMISSLQKTANLQEELVLTSSAPNKKVAKQLVLIGQKIKLVGNITQKLLDKTRSGTQAEQQAAKELEKVIEALVQPLEQAEAMVRGAEKTVLSLTKDNYKKLLGNIEVAVETIVDSIEAFSSGYSRDLQSLLDKHQRIITGLTKTFETRFREGRDQLMARGLSKEDATATLNKASSMQQMVRTLTLAKIKADVYQELLFGLDGIAGSLTEQNLPKLKEELSSLKSYLGEDGGGEKAASVVATKKRLNKVSKRILLLAYLRSKSL